MKLFSTALLLAAMTAPAFADQPAAPDQPAPLAPAAPPAPRQVQVQRVVVDAPDGVAGRPVVIVRRIEIDEDGNAVVMDENGDAVDEAEFELMLQDIDGGVMLEGVEQGQFNGVAHAGEAAMIQATYLGVNCQPLEKEEAVLMLVEPGTGLHVGHVAPDSPAAAAGLEPGDVLLQLNDQILINPEQLAVLVRTFDAGATVDLTVLRDGEEFVLQPVLEIAQLPEIGPGGRNLNQAWRVGPAQPQEARPMPPHIELHEINPDDLQQHMQDIEQRIRDQQEMILRFIEEIEGVEEGDGGAHADPEQPMRQLRHQIQIALGDVAAGNGNAQMNVAVNDGQHSIRINGDPNGQRHLHITDREGAILFDGDLPQTDEQWQQVPEPVRAKAKQLTDMNNIRIEVRPDAAPAQPEVPQAEEELPQA